MADSIHVRGEGGTIIEMDLPLPSHIAKRIISGQIQRVNADGSPFVPDPEVADDLGHKPGTIPAPGQIVPGLPTTEPPRNAAQPVWAGWAVVRGADPEVANGLSRAELIEKYATPAP
jgi:hypothetical protein